MPLIKVKTPSRQPGLLLSIIFLVIGAVFLAVAIFSYQSTVNFIQSSEQAEGEVIELRQPEASTSYYAVVRFTNEQAEEVTIVDSVGSSPPSYEVGEKVPVYYDSANPKNAKLGGFFSLWFLPVLFGFMGMIFDLIGAVFIISRSRKNVAADRRFLTQTAMADFLQISTRINSNSQQEFRVICTFRNPVDNRIDTFESAPLAFDPTEQLKKSGKIPVLLNPNNPKQYLVDVSSLKAPA